MLFCLSLSSVVVALDIGLRSLGDPGRDRVNAGHVVDQTLQVRVVRDQVGLGHVVEVVQDAHKVQIGPG